jgi:glycosyltransferase involved in cell wall biosynthesis
MFSVAIPIYNHARFVKQAIWSALRAPLVQEILLLDDGSKDQSAAIAARMAGAHAGRIRDLTPASGGNLGAHHRLNELVEMASCDWIAVLNSDDAFVTGRFEAVVANASFSACDFVFGNVLLMDERGRLTGAQRGPLDSCTPRPSVELSRMIEQRLFFELLREQNYVLTSSNMIFRKSLHAKIGGFRPYRYVHDWDFALRATALGGTAYIQRFLTAYRMHSGNTIRDNQRKTAAEIKTMLNNFQAEFPSQVGNRGF